MDNRDKQITTVRPEPRLTPRGTIAKARTSPEGRGDEPGASSRREALAQLLLAAGAGAAAGVVLDPRSALASTPVTDILICDNMVDLIGTEPLERRLVILRDFLTPGDAGGGASSTRPRASSTTGAWWSSGITIPARRSPEMASSGGGSGQGVPSTPAGSAPPETG